MTVGIILAAVTMAVALLFAVYGVVALHPRKNTLDWIYLPQKRPLTFACRRHRMTGGDALPLLLITALYAFTAFFRLGDVTAPRAFTDLASGETVTVELSAPISISGFRVYSGLGTGVEARDRTNSAYNVEVSPDGETWSTLWQRHDDPDHPEKITAYYWADAKKPSYALTQTYVELFKWRDVTVETPADARYLRLTGRPAGQTLRLGKLLPLDADGRPIAVSYSLVEGSPLDPALGSLMTVDETVPAEPDWTNSAYFDEIYHARTALEHLENVTPYEWTHPPLGKLIIGLGIRLFGMTPFGWRFMGTLFGVLMLPVLYIFLKNMFGKTAIAACGTMIFACDFMHLTQTRIATIDTYGVFFILLSYFFFYRWLTASATPNRHGDTGEGYGSLALSGVLFGVGVACKWTVLYAGAGLALLYLIHVIQRLRYWRTETAEKGRAPWLFKTLLLSVLCFVLIPAAIYAASYIPYVTAAGQELTLETLWNETVRNQLAMFRYHSAAMDAHPYSSRWYEWLVDARPILYYSRRLGDGLMEAFAAFNNPLLSWAGLGALAVVVLRAFQRRCGKAVFILLGYLAQFLPWVFIGRTTFAYHYFPSTLFLTLAVCYVAHDLTMSPRAKWKLPTYGLAAWSVTLYALFYPALVGLAIPVAYATQVLRWFPGWPLY